MSKKTNQQRIRTILRDSGGLTADVIAERMNSDVNLIRVVLNQMPDSYIGQWERTKAGAGYKAVWNVAHIPADAPRPKSVPTERKVYDAQYREKRKAKAKAAPAPEPTVPKTTWVKVPTWKEVKAPH